MIHRLAYLWLAVSILVLTACGGAPTTTTPAPTTETTPAAVTAPAATEAAPTATEATSATTEAAPTVIPEASPATTASAAATTEATGFPRTIKHGKGELKLDSPRQRVVALEWTYIEDLLALGIQPIGVADIAGYNDWVKIPLALDAQTVDVGTRNEPNLEKIATLKPDLIIAPASRIEATYDKLTQIAPTLAFVPYPTDGKTTQYDEMRSTLTEIAKAVGRDEQAQTVLAHMDAKFAEVRAALTQAGKVGQKFVLSQAYSGASAAEVRLFTINAMATQIVAQLGLEPAWKDAAFQQYGFSTVSVEALPELGDVNFFYVVQDKDNVFLSDSVKPLWESLPFVKAGHAYALGGDTWLFGGPLSAEVLADIIVKALVPTTSDAGSGDSNGTHVVKHAMGETTVALKPQRVVVLDSGELDAAVALGVTPVGSFTLFEGEGFLSYLSDKLDGVKPVGTIAQPNLEAIAALKPDLILSSKIRHEAIYDKLSAIAPTVFAETVGAPWRENFKLYAEAMGREQEGAKVIAAYEGRLSAFKQAMGDRINTQVSVLRVVEDGIRIIHKQMYIGVILADAGLARPPSQNVDDRFAVVSLEQIPDMDGDVIFASYFGKNDTAFKQLLEQPLWKANKAVAANKVYLINDDVWQTGLGYVSANLVIDDLEKYLLGS